MKNEHIDALIETIEKGYLEPVFPKFLLSGKVVMPKPGDNGHLVVMEKDLLLEILGQAKTEPTDVVQNQDPA